MSFDETSLATRSVLNVTPNGEGGAFWNAGAGPALDAAGSLYLLAANGTFDTSLTSAGFPAAGDFGNGFLKISTTGSLTVADYFATFDTVAKSNSDTDLGSGGAMLLPDQTDASGTVRPFRYPGTTPSVSANGSSGAIVWAVENGSGSVSSVLHAYDAGDLTHELYHSDQNAARDDLGPGNKFITPTVAAGKVYVGTTNSVAVYGLLH